jgi:hypothetical protein
MTDQGFPRVYAVVKWLVVASLIVLAIAAAAFWTMVLGGFAGSGFHAQDPAGRDVRQMAITPECAWPYGVDAHDAAAVCRMFHNMTPEQREQALRMRKSKTGER